MTSVFVDQVLSKELEAQTMNKFVLLRLHKEFKFNTKIFVA